MTVEAVHSGRTATFGSAVSFDQLEAIFLSLKRHSNGQRRECRIMSVKLLRAGSARCEAARSCPVLCTSLESPCSQASGLRQASMHFRLSNITYQLASGEG